MLERVSGHTCVLSLHRCVSDGCNGLTGGQLASATSIDMCVCTWCTYNLGHNNCAKTPTPTGGLDCGGSDIRKKVLLLLQIIVCSLRQNKVRLTDWRHRIRTTALFLCPGRMNSSVNLHTQRHHHPTDLPPTADQTKCNKSCSTGPNAPTEGTVEVL
ncbi:uncharacterized protein ZHAS_00007863 [Anopheles sinensis]|uniref:Uncharacterized protein n=1 Tax=Anopheles sinensis TaxID=74873 RepID=A0A084VQZ5_ANOSI|nr:uncharacterized protein ZHAS_00007863 [Anopheles sinensis]